MPQIDFFSYFSIFTFFFILLLILYYFFSNISSEKIILTTTLKYPYNNEVNFTEILNEVIHLLIIVRLLLLCIKISLI